MYPQVGPHLFFDANGRTDRPENFQNPFVEGGNNRGLVSRDMALKKSQFARSGNWGQEATLPETAMARREWRSGLGTPVQAWNDPARAAMNPYGNQQMAGTQPAQAQMAQMQQQQMAQPTGAGAPQALGTNALMGQGFNMQDPRKPMMPLQGYQNALLRGF